MSAKTRSLLVVAVVIGLLLVLWLVLALNCPNVGIAFTSRTRQLHRLKNRTALPQDADFDTRVTLDQLLQPGDDTYRWSTARAARIQGEVIDVAYARPEATNCFSPCRRDIHILLAERKGAAKNEAVVLEVTPNLRESATTQGIDWSEQTLQRELIGHWCEFDGWLYFDVSHADQSENTAAHHPGNWRATAWEVHPVTKIRVLQ